MIYLVLVLENTFKPALTILLFKNSTKFEKVSTPKINPVMTEVPIISLW